MNVEQHELARRASDPASSPESRRRVEQLLEECLRRRASDIHLRVGAPPVFRVDGRLHRLGDTPLGSSALEALCRSLCTNRQWQEIQTSGTTDLGLVSPSGERFRAETPLRETRWLSRLCQADRGGASSIAHQGRCAKRAGRSAMSSCH